MATKHTKPSMQNQAGGIVQEEAAIDVSNVMLLHNGPVSYTHLSDKGNMKPAFEQKKADASIETSSPQEYSKTDFVMSTVLSEKIYGTKDVTQDIKEELDKLEKDQLSWREDHSVVSKINADAQKGIKTKLDSDMTSWVEDSLELAKRSNGAFDPTIGRLTRLWNIEAVSYTHLYI